MPSFFGLAEQVLASATGGSDEVRKTGGHEYNTPHHRQHPQGGQFNTEEVLSHAEAGDEDREYITNAVRHVHENSHEHHEQVNEGDLSKYGPVIMNALSAVSSKSGHNVGSFLSGGLGEGGGNQLMGLVMKQVGSTMGGGGEEKQSFMNGAAMTLTKLVAQKQLSAFVGGSNSGGLGMMEVGERLLKNRFG